MEESPILRVVTCGSVDDGKSTLIGRLFFDLDQIPTDHLESIREDSKTVGTRGGDLDLALLTDGLIAERAQGITIDVAYRYLSTERRRIIVADTPGHEQYTRNMATGASTADVAVVLMDARKGLLGQTQRHTRIVRLLGVRNIFVAVNKMDLINFDEEQFRNIVTTYEDFARTLGDCNVVPIPICALDGDNVTRHSDRMDWYDGPHLLEALEGFRIPNLGERHFRLSVQLAIRPNESFRGSAGLVESGRVRVGDSVVVQPSGARATVARIVTMGRLGEEVDLQQAVRGQSIVLVFEEQIDCGRGDLVCSSDDPPELANQFRTALVWMSDSPMIPGRSYLLKIGSQTAGVSLSAPKSVVDVTSGESSGKAVLGLNDIGYVNANADRMIAFDRYEENRETGGLIIIDRYTKETIAAGMIQYSLRRSHNLHRHVTTVDRTSRAQLKNHAAAVVWLTGLSGAGKSTIANALESSLYEIGIHTALLDGDNVRLGLNKDLGFSEADRTENIRRLSEVAGLMAEAGLVVIVASISPFRAERDAARRVIEPVKFIEVHCDISVADAERRDPKGLYAKARSGQLPNFTGIDSPYEAPLSPELRLDCSKLSVTEAVSYILEALYSSDVMHR